MDKDKEKWTNGLNDAFDTEFESSNNISKDMIDYKKDFENKKNDLVERVKNSSELTLQDADLIRSEIVEMVASSKVILDRLEETLQVGAPPRAFEVYSTLLNSRLGTLKELKELSKSIIDVKILDKKENGTDLNPTNVNNTVVMMLSGEELDNMINKVNIENSLTEIDTDFKITEEDIK